jgi:hypothetical protein
MAATRDTYAPGSPIGIRSLSALISNTALLANDAQRELSAVSSNCDSSLWEGASATRFQQIVGKLPSNLALMHSGYDTVASALSTYASALETIQSDVDNAIAQQVDAESRRATADAARQSASARVNALSLQVAAARAREYALQVELLATTDPATAHVLQQQCSQAEADRSQVESALRSAESDCAAHVNEIASADSDLRRIQSQLDGYGDDRRAAEQQCARTVSGALPEGLHDPSFWRRAAKAIEHAVDEVGHDLLNDAYALHKLLHVLSEVLKIVTIVLLVLEVLAIVACFVAGFFVGPEVWALIPVLMEIDEVVGDVSVGVDALSALDDATLYAAEYRDPDTGEDAVTGWDVVGDELTLGVDLLGLGLGDSETPIKDWDPKSLDQPLVHVIHGEITFDLGQLIDDFVDSANSLARGESGGW